MQPAAAASTESVSQRKRAMDFIRKISIRRHQLLRLRYRRRQHSLPADLGISTQSVSQELENIAPDSASISNRLENNASSGANLVGLAKSENNERATQLADVNQFVSEAHAPSRDAAHPTEQSEQRTGADVSAGVACERPAMIKSHSFPTAVDAVGEEQVVRKGVRNKLQRAKIRTITSLRAARHKVFNREQIETENATRLPMSSPSYNESVYVKPVKSEEEEKHMGIADDQRDVKNTKEETRECEEVEKLRRDLSESYHQIAELQKRCEAQSRDLENSNNFLNTADKSSDWDIIHALQRLNAEVQQNATYMADYLAENLEFGHVAPNVEKGQSLAVRRATDYIGPVLVKSFATKTMDEIPMLLQIAFQAYLVSALCQTASSWAFEPSYNAFIDGIYQRLRRSEAQAISGRWRSLARFHIVHNWNTEPSSLAKEIIAGLSDILLAAGCTASQHDIVSKITPKFEEKVTLLIELAGRLNKLFDEVISSDFEVFVVRPGEKFECKKMEDPDGDQVGLQEGSVLCATQLGLVKRMPVGTLWERGGKRKVMVQKAKVMLESFLEAED